MPFSLLQSSRTLVIVVSLAIILVLAVFNFGSWFFIDRMEASLESELETRLLAVARLGAEVVENSPFVSLQAQGQELSAGLLISSTLELLTREIEVQHVMLVDRHLRALASSDEVLFPPGREIVYLWEDSSTIAAAWDGETVASALRVIAGARFKTAYAPVRDPEGQVICLFVVEANAGFFELLRNFRRGLVLGSIASFVVLVIFAVFLVSAISLFLRTQENLRRSERLAAMGQMAATVAHEIRNPLGIIKNTAEVLRQKYDNREQPDELFEFIPAEVNRLTRLMNDFLSFAREKELRRTRGDLVQTVQRALAMMRNEDAGSGVQWHLTTTRDQMPADYDEDALTQVLVNLLLNASQAMNRTGRVDIHLEEQGRDTLHVSIRDHGPGLPAPAEKIFEPFFTTKSRGSGLGLPVSRQVMEKHGGRLEAESHPGAGTTMHLWLPRA